MRLLQLPVGSEVGNRFGLCWSLRYSGGLDSYPKDLVNNAQIRLGVDIGGTFTDVVLEVDGRHWSVKVLTTYTAPEDGILQGLEEVCAQA